MTVGEFAKVCDYFIVTVDGGVWNCVTSEDLGIFKNYKIENIYSDYSEGIIVEVTS